MSKLFVYSGGDVKFLVKDAYMKNSINKNETPSLVHLENIKIKQIPGLILAPDIGGTQARLALFEVIHGVLSLLKEELFKTKDYSSFFNILKHFCSEEIPNISSLCLGIAGPVNEGRVQATNFSWVIDKSQIIKETKIQSVWIINDMEAHAYGLEIMAKDDFHELKKGSVIPGNAGIISPGTGLGEAGLFWNGKIHIPFATEGGHCDFSPRNEMDLEIWRFLHAKFGQVSWETIVSGPGIYNIYLFLIQYRNIREPDWFLKEISEGNPTVIISNCAKNQTYPVCTEVIDLFLRFLAIEAAQLALKFKATGGIYIGGGIILKIIDMVDKEKFQKEFVDSHRMSPLLDLIPVNIILNEKTAIYGAAVFAIRNFSE